MISFPGTFAFRESTRKPFLEPLLSGKAPRHYLSGKRHDISFPGTAFPEPLLSGKVPGKVSGKLPGKQSFLASLSLLLFIYHLFTNYYFVTN